MRLRDLERSTASASPARGSSHSTLVCDHVERLKRGDAFRSVDGERIWLAMHGHDVRWTKRTTPASLFHSRVLDPSSRSKAEPVARWLALCGWLRARRAGLRPGKVQLEATVGDRRYAVLSQIQHPGGEGEVMAATSAAWRALKERYHSGAHYGCPRRAVPRPVAASSICLRVPTPLMTHSLARMPRSGIGSGSGQFAVGKPGIRRDPTPGSRFRSSGCRRWRRWTSSWDPSG